MNVDPGIRETQRAADQNMKFSHAIVGQQPFQKEAAHQASATCKQNISARHEHGYQLQTRRQG
jgi:hypothetical protein